MNGNGELPRGWVDLTLGQVATSTKGKKPRKEYPVPQSGAIPYINIRAFERKEIETYTDDPVCPTCDPSDTLIVWDGARCGLVGRGARGAIGSTLAKIKSDVVASELLFYFLFSHFGTINKRPKGVGIPHVDPTVFWELQFCLPPLPEQKRIVAKIEELFTRLDAGVAALKQIKLQLKRYRQAVLKHAFEGKLTAEWRKAQLADPNSPLNKEPAVKLLERIKEERKQALGKKYKELPPVDTSDLPDLPEGWVWGRLGQIGNVVTGTTPSKAKAVYFGKGFPFFKPTDLNVGYYVRSASDNLTEDGLSESRLLPAGTTLVTCIGATIGKTGLIRVPGASNQQINAVIPENGILPEFLYWACISPDFQKSIIDNASATTLPILNKSRFEALPLQVPPFAEQGVIVQEIERCFSIADAIEQAIEQSQRQSDRLRQSILKRAFEGKLVPQDPNDEPAAKLLERIRAEREGKEETKQAARKAAKAVRKPRAKRKSRA